MSENPGPFPFLVGCGRSGTTLARALLDAHPAMAVPGESYFPVWLARERHRYHHNGSFQAIRLADDLLADPWFRHWDLSDSAVRRALEEPAITTFSEAIRRVYALYARGRSKSRYADKTPTFVLHIELLAELFPEAVFVHIVRDGRDVALSLLQATWGPATLAGGAQHWRHHVEQGRQAGQRLGERRYRELRYEDLLDDPEASARSLCRFVDLDYDGAMLSYNETAPALLARLPDAEEHQNLRLPPTKGLRDWRREMAIDDIATFEALAGDLLGDLGYERRAPVPTIRVRLRAATLRGRWFLDQRARQARATAARTIGR